jgi:hypothetical protein
MQIDSVAGLVRRFAAAIHLTPGVCQVSASFGTDIGRSVASPRELQMQLQAALIGIFAGIFLGIFPIETALPGSVTEGAD